MNKLRTSNWGRWGVDDERGTLNMLTPEHVGRVVRTPSRGKVYSLGAPAGRDGPIIGLRNTTHHYMSAINNDPSPGGRGSADDVLVTHSHASTHIDGHGHLWYDNQLYNGHPASVVTPDGAVRCGVQNVDWIVTRGVLLDIAALMGVSRLGKMTTRLRKTISTRQQVPGTSKSTRETLFWSARAGTRVTLTARPNHGPIHRA